MEVRWPQRTGDEGRKGWASDPPCGVTGTGEASKRERVAKALPGLFELARLVGSFVPRERAFAALAPLTAPRLPLALFLSPRAHLPQPLSHSLHDSPPQSRLACVINVSNPPGELSPRLEFRLRLPNRSL